MPRGGALDERIRRRVAASTNAFSITLNRKTALMRLCRQQPILPADRSYRAWRLAVRLHHLANIFFLADAGVHPGSSALRFAQRRTVDAHGVAVMP